MVSRRRQFRGVEHSPYSLVYVVRGGYRAGRGWEDEGLLGISSIPAELPFGERPKTGTEHVGSVDGQWDRPGTHPGLHKVFRLQPGFRFFDTHELAAHRQRRHFSVKVEILPSDQPGLTET